MAVWLFARMDWKSRVQFREHKCFEFRRITIRCHIWEPRFDVYQRIATLPQQQLKGTFHTKELQTNPESTVSKQQQHVNRNTVSTRHRCPIITPAVSRLQIKLAGYSSVRDAARRRLTILKFRCTLRIIVSEDEWGWGVANRGISGADAAVRLGVADEAQGEGMTSLQLFHSLQEHSDRIPATNGVPVSAQVLMIGFRIQGFDCVHTLEKDKEVG